MKTVHLNLLLHLFLLLPIQSRAESLRVYYASTLKPRAVCHVMKKALFQFELESGVKLDPTFKKLKLPRMDAVIHPLELYDPYFNQLPSGGPVFFLVEKTKENGIRGAAEICGRFGVSAMGKMLNRWDASIFSVLHELGHLKGAQHQGGDQIMNPAPVGTAYRNNWILHFNDQSVAEINTCEKK